MTLQPADLERLEQLAREATPGPWTVSTDRSDDDLGACVDVEGPTIADDDYPFIVAPNVELRDARLIAALSPAVLSELVAAARLGAAWQEAEAVLPADWELELSVGGHGRRDLYTAAARFCYSLRYYRANVGPARETPFEMAFGPTPAAALTALAEALRERP